MSDLYDGLAAVAVIARYLLQAPVERSTLQCPIRVSDAGAGRVRVELQEYLHAPRAANLLHVTLPDGRSLQGQIVDVSEPLAVGVNPIEALNALNLPPPVYMQVGNLLARVETCLSLDDLQRVADRAEGFVLGIETVRAVNYSTIEGLHVLFKDAVQAHREALKA